MTQAEAVKAALRQFPNHPKRTIARFLTQAHPKIFKSIDQARDSVRLHSGSKKATDARQKNNALLPPTPCTPSAGKFPLPTPIDTSFTNWRPVHIPEFGAAAVIADVHVPYHDLAALEVALAHLDKVQPDRIILLGDLLDFYAISFFARDPEGWDLQSEISKGVEFLKHLRGRFPKSAITYKDGNHEERLPRYAWERCPALSKLMDKSGTPLLSTRYLLQLDDLGIDHVGDKKPILLGEHLYLLHGHEFRKPMTNPVNPARGLFLRTGCNALCGDLHQTSQHTDPGLARVTSTFSIGCLCQLHAPYMPLNKWNHGFAVVRNNGGAWAVDNHKIISGKVV